MVPKFSNYRLGAIAFYATIGCLAFALSLQQIKTHVAAVTVVREQALPLLAELPVLERRRDLLEQQLELTQVQSALRIGSFDEQIRVHVVPQELQLSRLIEVFQALQAHWELSTEIGETSELTIGDTYPTPTGLTALPLTFQVPVTEAGAYELQQHFAVTGLMTVADALRQQQRQQLFASVEEHSPTGIVPLEQFLSTQLNTYVQDSQSHEAALKRAVPNPIFAKQVLDVIEQSELATAKQVLHGSLLNTLEQNDLWPTPFFALKKLDLRRGRSPGWWLATVTVETYSRSE